MRPSQVKSATAFRTISEVASDLDVPQHVLRFWETRFPQIRPLKRGGGRRYYRPEDVDLLRVIQRLLYREGYTIRGVQRLLRERRAGIVSLTGGDVGSVESQKDSVDADALALDAPPGERPGEPPPDPVSAEPPRPFPPPPAITPGVRGELEALLAELQAMKRLLASLN